MILQFALWSKTCRKTSGFHSGFRRVPASNVNQNFASGVDANHFKARVPSGFLRVPTATRRQLHHNLDPKPVRPEIPKPARSQGPLLDPALEPHPADDTALQSVVPTS